MGAGFTSSDHDAFTHNYLWRNVTLIVYEDNNLNGLRNILIIFPDLFQLGRLINFPFSV